MRSLVLVFALVVGLLSLAMSHDRAAAVAPSIAPPPTGTGIPASRLADRVGIISIRGPIDDMTLRSLERRVARAQAEGCGAIVLELDTPGGDLGATLAICHLLNTQAPANRVAWVRPQAYSAGAIIALACGEIVMSPTSVIGDAAPIAVMPGLGMQPIPLAERAKFESPVLAEVNESALRNGHDVRLVRAMVKVDDELWLAERDDGKRLFMNAEEYEIVFGSPPFRGAGGYVPAEGPLADPAPATVAAAVDESEVEIERMVLAPRVTGAERGRWKLLGQVDSATELVTLREREAQLYGLATAIIANEAELASYFGATTLLRYDETWSEAIVRFLVSWPVRGVLIVVMILAFFAEMTSPGVGAFGTVALAALVVLVGAPMIAGLAEWWEILLVIVGAGLVALELFVLPGMGLIGILGIVCMLVGFVFSFVGGDLSSAQSQSDLLAAFLTTLGSFVVAGLGLAVLGKHLPKSGLVRRFMLDATVNDAGPALAVAMGPLSPELRATGVTTTDLRPSGRARFGDAVIDVRTEGGWVAAGTPVRIVARDSLGAVVETVS